MMTNMNMNNICGNKGYFERKKAQKFKKECTEAIEAAAVLGIACGVCAGGYALVLVGVEAAINAPAKIKNYINKKKAEKANNANNANA